MMKKKSWIGLLVWSFFSFPTWASDLNRERAYADEITQTLSLGQVVWLEADGTEFLGLYAETEKLKNYGTAIILHDVGGHPDQKKIVHTLRTLLPDHNWATLSLQMPIRESGAVQEAYYTLFPEALLRIQAGLEFLSANGTENIVLIGYGLGSLMAVYFQSQKASSSISAIVTISLPVPDKSQQTLPALEYIKKIDVPQLDLYASQDLPEVRNSARKRRMAAKENAAYRQLKIDAEGHRFEHDEGLIVKRVYSWLNRIVNYSVEE